MPASAIQNRQLSATGKASLTASASRRLQNAEIPNDFHPHPLQANHQPLNDHLSSLLYQTRDPKSTITAFEKPPSPSTSSINQSEIQPETMSASITAAQVKEHATPEKGLYIIIDNSVYSMADFADEHPGGSKILKRVGGKGMPSTHLHIKTRSVMA